MKYARVPVAWMSLLALSVSVSRAEYTLDELLELNLEQLMEIQVVTASRHPVELRRVPGVVRVVTRQQIRERGYRHLGELLADQPGIQVQRLNNHEYNNRIAINGVSGNNKFLILQDGVRINSPTGEALPVDYNFPLYHLERVEIMYGPASALYGADAMSGVINLITRKPAERHAEIALETGEFESRYAHVRVEDSLGDKLRLSLGGHRQIRDGQNFKEIYDSADINAGFGAATTDGVYLPTDSYSINLRLDAGEQYKLFYNESQSVNSTHISGEVNIEDYATEANYIQRLRTLALEANWMLDSRWSMVLRGNHSEYRVDPESRYVNVYSGFVPGWKYAEGRRNQIEPQFVWQSDAHAVTLGASYEDYFSLPQTDDLATPYDGSQSVTQLDYLNRGIYAEWHADWQNGLQSTLGARHDHPSEYGMVDTPRLNLVYSESDHTVWRMGYGKAFLAPAPFFRYKQYGGGLFVPNPDLRPELLESLDLAWQRRWSDNWMVDLVLYKLKIEDVIYSSTGNTLLNPGSYQNLGLLDNQGVNLAVNWKPVPGLETWLSLGYLDGEVGNADPMQTYDHYPVLFTSRWRGVLGLTWKTERYTFTPSMEFADRADGGFSAVNEGASSPGYAVVDVFAALRRVLTKNDEVSLKVFNLLDRKWYQPGDGFSDFAAVPQETRSILLGYTWRYR